MLLSGAIWGYLEYMSEIPLHTFGRNRKSRAGYTPLQNGEPGDDDHNDDHDQVSSNRTMRAGIRAAATSSSVNRKGKRRERYADDPDEEATLLGDAVHEEGEFRDDEPQEPPRDSSSEVR